jgi:hypothetical protein
MNRAKELVGRSLAHAGVLFRHNVWFDLNFTEVTVRCLLLIILFITTLLLPRPCHFILAFSSIMLSENVDNLVWTATVSIYRPFINHCCY